MALTFRDTFLQIFGPRPSSNKEFNDAVVIKQKVRWNLIYFLEKDSGNENLQKSVFIILFWNMKYLLINDYLLLVINHPCIM